MNHFQFLCTLTLNCVHHDFYHLYWIDLKLIASSFSHFLLSGTCPLDILSLNSSRNFRSSCKSPKIKIFKVSMHHGISQRSQNFELQYLWQLLSALADFSHKVRIEFFQISENDKVFAQLFLIYQKFKSISKTIQCATDYWLVKNSFLKLILISH